MVMEALAHALRLMPWSKLSLRYVAQKRRADLFCAAFERHNYRVTWKSYRSDNGETDKLIIPRISLPDIFEDYLASSVSTETQRRYHRFKRKFVAAGAYRFTHSSVETFDADIATLMGFWKQKWDENGGSQNTKSAAESFEKVLKAALKTDALFLPILWRGDVPLAALGHVMDPKTGAMHFMIAGQDQAATEPFIGAALHFHSIECAILLGCQHYDFGHGDEEYKFGYGAERTELSYFSITRVDTDAENVFDSICTGAALRQIESFLKAGKTDQARRACRQLSQIFR
jgi:CelD/BcsL family acetyltransferase involved in cellulose biosynthesis